MPLLISPSVQAITVPRGEPIVFSYQPCDSEGNPEDLDGRKFVWAVYTVEGKDITEVTQFDGVTSADDSGPIVLWAERGTVTKALWDETKPLRWDLVERHDDGHYTIRTGTLTIEASAPNIADYDGVQISRYMHRIQKRANPDQEDNPQFRVTTAPFVGSSVAPVGWGPDEWTTALTVLF